MKNIFKLQSGHIYITSDEEIKEGCWFYYKHFGEDIISKVSENTDLVNLNNRDRFFQKIILTTDQDLIKDGVQAIDDEFLEWFVKNPSCEFVDVHIMNKGYNNKKDFPYQECYRIIIPKEEFKQETLMDLYLKNNPEKAVVIEQRVSDFMNQLKPKQ